VSARALSIAPDDDGEPYLERLRACDQTLTVIASDVEGLLNDLVQMRSRAETLEERCVRHEDAIRERDAVIARLEDDFTQATRLVEDLRRAAGEASDDIATLEARAGVIEDERDRLQDSLEQRTEDLAAAERQLAAARASSDGEPPTAVRNRSTLGEAKVRAAGAGFLRPGSASTHVRFVALPGGYHLTTSEEPCAEAGDRIVVDDYSFLVTKVGRSPLPDDPRPCVFLLADAPRR
jgi:hypothetical protein